jgi:8-oxo-dGTP diphosphatase
MNRFEQINWTSWQPMDRAVVVYIIDKEQKKVLLISKKTGLGKGKVTGPGGKLESGESYLDAAIRECQEEVSIKPLDLEKRAELHFQFTHGYAMYGEAFFTDSWEGEAKSSKEADPFWCDLEKIPLDNMWEDDRNWLHQALEGKKLRGFYVFDGDKIVSEKTEELENFDE